MNPLKNLVIKTLDLESPEVRSNYSVLLTEHEEIFTYPLGEKIFHICHGNGESYDYFSFFEQLGEVHYLVAEDQDDNQKLVAAGCALLRTIGGKKVWYLCDFKLVKEYRGQGILEKMFKKFLIPFYLKSSHMFFVNMSPMEGNRLIEKLLKIFKIFGLNKEELYFFEWTKETIERVGLDLNQFLIVTNEGKKDVILENAPYPIYHLVDKNSSVDFSKFKKVHLKEINNQATLMYCGPKNDTTETLLKTQTPTNIGSFVSHRHKSLLFSSCEI